MMATNSNVPTAEPGVFGPRRRGNASSRSPRLVDAQELWDIDDVASYLGVTKQTIYSWRTTGYGPAGFRVGKHLRWGAATVINWTVRLEENQ
ncbi:helix-turn-helix transcriptional regulator [Nocardioides sp.]|uniref:helix-turn-helix transcriptional regulator n=1 Tax=Nocardioidaceae TaxID=85015 RepID=UPI003510FC77